MFSEQLSEQQFKDGVSLKKLRANSEQWGAIQRLMLRLRNDAFDVFANSDKEKAWLQGARHLLEQIEPTVNQMIEDSEAVLEEQKEEQAKPGQHGIDVGSNDLAIG